MEEGRIKIEREELVRYLNVAGTALLHAGVIAIAGSFMSDEQYLVLSEILDKIGDLLEELGAKEEVGGEGNEGS